MGLPPVPSFPVLRVLRPYRRLSFRLFGLRASGLSPSVSPLVLPFPFASRERLPLFITLDSSGVGEVAVPFHPSACCGPQPCPGVNSGRPGPPSRSRISLDLSGPPRAWEALGEWLLSDKVGSDRGVVPRRMIPASGGFTVPLLSQAQPLGYLPSPHCAFQGHAAHPTERSAGLSPKGSMAT